MQGGPGSDLLQGDHADFFFLDPGEFEPGNDIMVGQTNDNDYDTEGGDDIEAASSSIEKYVGSGGFDWATHQWSPVPADDDMRLNALLDLAQPVVVNRDRWQETEASSGYKFDDVIRGDDLVPSTLGGAGFTGCDVLDAAGVARIRGLNAIIPPLTGALQPVIDLSAAEECPLSGPIWGEGNILIGGGGSDTIEGRGGDDIIDGDRGLTARISVRNAAGAEIGTTDLMEKQYQRNAAGALTGPTLMAAVAAGTVNPADLQVIRSLNTTTEPWRTLSVGTTNASTALTAAAGSFKPADVGGTITGIGIPAGATITAVTGTGSGATLSAAATGHRHHHGNHRAVRGGHGRTGHGRLHGRPGRLHRRRSWPTAACGSPRTRWQSARGCRTAWTSLRNVERLQFRGSAGTAQEFLNLSGPNAPRNVVAAVAGNGTATVTWTGSGGLRLPGDHQPGAAGHPGRHRGQPPSPGIGPDQNGTDGQRAHQRPVVHVPGARRERHRRRPAVSRLERGDPGGPAGHGTRDACR